MRLIDADVFKTHLEHEVWSRGHVELLRARDIADETPTVDAVPVRHGKWTVTPIYIKCSECGESFMLIPQNYCPNCGARMDAEKE